MSEESKTKSSKPPEPSDVRSEAENQPPPEPALAKREGSQAVSASDADALEASMEVSLEALEASLEALLAEERVAVAKMIDDRRGRFSGLRFKKWLSDFIVGGGQIDDEHPVKQFRETAG